MLYIASFYAPENWVGGAYRISRQHPRGRKVQWESLPFLYPARELIRAYRAHDIDFSQFAEEYREGLESRFEQSAEFQEWVRSVPSLGDFTLLCFEREGEPCHRLVLARWLQERVPSMEVGALR
jgi:uncharacterized protein YeaO (DUF488 family)